MDFEYLCDGTSYLIKIDGGRSGEYKAMIEDKEYAFSASNISPNEFSILIGNKNMKVFVAESDDTVFVHIGGKIAQLNKPNINGSGVGGPGVEFEATDEISTPMPGKVVKILISKGDKVETGQSLLIVESMKMENEIKSPIDGEVVSVNYSDGDLVEPGQIIIKLNPKK